MVSRALFTVVLLLISFWFVAPYNLKPNGSYFPAMQNHFDSIQSTDSSSCGFPNPHQQSRLPTMDEISSSLSHNHPLKLHLTHRSHGIQKSPKASILESSIRDLSRIQTFRRRILEDRNQNSASRSTSKRRLLAEETVFHGQLMGSLKSGVSSGSGEYFMDVLIGSPPKKFSLIVDTGSDLNWIQCLPCHDCFDQIGPVYNPEASTSFQNISCRDARCALVSSPDPPRPCKASNQTCPYFYWYGDSSNTTGDFSLETFTVNVSTPSGNTEFRKLDKVMFGCGHWNRGLFHGAAGLLGLGRGPLSFSSQIESQYGHTFSYCLVDRDSAPNITSRLIFGEHSHQDLKFNYTKLAVGKENPVDTFYYLEVNSIFVGGEELNIPEDSWRLSDDGGGTIVDSGTTLSYFVEPAHRVIKEAFERNIKGYKLVEDFPLLGPCYNVSAGWKTGDFPGFGIRFRDGTVWNFPVQNYFIKVDENVVCLAFLSTPAKSFSIIGNYQQQNFHVLYDNKRSRLGFKPARCAEI